MPLNSTIRMQIEGSYTKAGDLGTIRQDFVLNLVKALQSGVTDGKADKLFSDRRTLAASDSEELDLDSVLADAFGDTLDFAEIVAIAVKAADSNVNDVIVGGAASNAFVGPFGAADNTLAVKPGGCALLFAPNTGWAVTGGTGDLLKVANSSSGSTVTYDIVVIGRSS